MRFSFQAILRSYSGRFILIFALVFISAQAGLLLLEEPYFAFLIWPAYGIATGLLIIYGKKFLPAVLLSLFLCFYSHDYTSIELFIAPFRIGLILSISGTLIIILKKYFVERVIKNSHSISNPAIFLKLLLVLFAISLSLASIVFLFILTSDFFSTGLIKFISLAWIGSDLIGSIIFIPFVLSFNTKTKDEITGSKLEKMVLHVLFLIMLLGLIFFKERFPKEIVYLLLPLLFWIAFRFNIKDTTIGLVVISVITTYTMIIHKDDSATIDYFSSIFFCHIFLLISSVVFYFINGFSLQRVNRIGNLDYNSIDSLDSDLNTDNTSHAVEKQLQLLQTAIKQSPGTIIITNQLGEIEYANPAFTRITGYRLKEVMGKNPRILKSGYHPESYYKELWDTILQGKTWTGQFYNKKKDGTPYWEEATIAPIYIKGEILHFICTKEDITERINAESFIKESEKKFRTFFENTKVNILLIDPDSGKIVDANNTALEYYGYTKEELRDLSFFEILILDADKNNLKLNKILDFNKKMISLRQKLKSGRIQDTEVYPTPVNIENKTLIFTIIQDVTRRKKAIAALTESESKKLALLKIIPDLIFVVNREGVILDIYVEKLSNLAMPPSEMLGKKMIDILPKDHGKKFEDNFRTTFDTRDVITFEYSYKIKGKEVFEEIRLIVSGEDELLVIIRDITNQKKSQEDLKNAWREAKKANTAKSAFIANVSHEIRTPINAIIGFSELLAKEVNQSHLEDYVNSIKSSSKTLLSLIDDILDFSKIEAGKLDIKTEFINIQSILEDTRNIFWLKMEQKKLSFNTYVTDNTPKLLLLDALKVRQILINLISNAYKFTEKGEVKVEIESVDKKITTQKTCVDIIIRVSDTGIGISKDFQKTIFEAFKQQEEQDSRKYGGTGLGLAITHRLVELMKGSIKLDSEPGKGSSFEVIIPDVESGLRTESRPVKITRKYIRFHNCKVLVVDDVLSNRELLKGAIKGEDIIFSEADDGQKAIDILKTEKHDVVLLDLNLPEVSGFDVAKFMKSSSRLKNVPIIGISAIHIIKNHDQISKYFDVFLSKPFDINVLLEHLKRYLPYEEQDLSDKSKIESIVQKEDMSFDLQNSKSLSEAINVLLIDYRVVVDTSSFKEFKDFAKRLNEVAKEYKIIMLEETAEKIIKASDNFDIETMNQFMAHVPSILNKINERIKKNTN